MKLITFFVLGASLALAQEGSLDNIASRQYQHEVRPLRLALDRWLHELGLQDIGLCLDGADSIKRDQLNTVIHEVMHMVIDPPASEGQGGGHLGRHSAALTEATSSQMSVMDKIVLYMAGTMDMCFVVGYLRTLHSVEFFDLRTRQANFSLPASCHPVSRHLIVKTTSTFFNETVTFRVVPRLLLVRRGNARHVASSESGLRGESGLARRGCNDPRAGAEEGAGEAAASRQAEPVVLGS